MQIDNGGMEDCLYPCCVCIDPRLVPSPINFDEPTEDTKIEETTEIMEEREFWS